MLPQGSTTPSCAQEPCARFKEMIVRFMGIVSSSASPGELLYRLSMPGPRFLPCGCGGLSCSQPVVPQWQRLFKERRRRLHHPGHHRRPSVAPRRALTPGRSRCRHVLAPNCATGGPYGPPMLRFRPFSRPWRSSPPSKVHGLDPQRPKCCHGSKEGDDDSSIAP